MEKIKLIIAGGRDFNNKDLMSQELLILQEQYQIVETVNGGANGADKLGGEWSKKNNIPIKYFEAEWDKFGKSAGPIRNGQMAKYGDFLLAFWDGKSRGTASMISQAKGLGVTVKVVYTSN